MDREEELIKIEEIQSVVEQMRLDDIEENPDSEFDYFDCDCCGKTAVLAGSVLYPNFKRLCNSCVLKAEIAFALGKIQKIEDLISVMENDRLEELCEYIKQDEQRVDN